MTRPTSHCTSRSYAPGCAGAGRSVAAQIADDLCADIWRAVPRCRVQGDRSRPARGSARTHPDRSSSRDNTSPASGPFQIQRQRLLRSVQPDKWLAIPGRTCRTAREIADHRPLNLDDSRAQVGQLTCPERNRHCLFERENRDTSQRQRRHRESLAGAETVTAIEATEFTGKNATFRPVISVCSVVNLLNVS